MLSNSEKRFVESWQEQRGSSKVKYYVQYTFAWGIVIFLSLFFIIKLIMSDRSMGGLHTFYVLLPIALVLSFIATHLTFIINERKLKKLIDRDKRA